MRGNKNGLPSQVREASYFDSLTLYKKEENEMRTEISRIWLENEAVAERKMANELGYCVEVYRRRVAEEEDIESNLYNGEVI